MSTTPRPYDLTHPCFRLLDSGSYDATDQAIAENMLREEAARLLGADRDSVLALVRKGREGWYVRVVNGSTEVSTQGHATSASAVDRVVRVLRGPSAAPPSPQLCDCYQCGGTHRVVNCMGVAWPCDKCACVP